MQLIDIDSIETARCNRRVSREKCIKDLEQFLPPVDIKRDQQRSLQHVTCIHSCDVTCRWQVSEAAGVSRDLKECVAKFAE
jgi:hypothetical protein